MTQTVPENSLARLLDFHGDNLDHLARKILFLYKRLETSHPDVIDSHPDVIDRLEQAIVMLADVSDHLNWCARTMRRENK